MRAWIGLVFLGLIAATPAGARAENCDDERESCLETCQIDHGMEADRVKLAKCVKRCEDKLEDCRDLRYEERRNYARMREKAPEIRRVAPPDVRSDEEGGADHAVRPLDGTEADEDARLDEKRPSTKKPGRRESVRDAPQPAENSQAPAPVRKKAPDEVQETER